MNDIDKTKDQLVTELMEARQQIEELDVSAKGYSCLVKMLQRDYFADIWNCLENETHQLLVKMEDCVNSDQIGEMIGIIDQILEVELASVFPLLSPLSSIASADPVLTRIKKALEEYPVTREYIDNFKIRSEDKIFIKEQLPDYLKRVVNCNNYFVSEVAQIDESKYSCRVEDAMDIRRNLLGIRRKGILPRLAMIKRILNSYPPGMGGNLP